MTLVWLSLVSAGRTATAGIPATPAPGLPVKPKPNPRPKPKPKASLQPTAEEKPSGKTRPAASASSKVVVFVFLGDPSDTSSVRQEIVRLLRARRMTVITTLRPVDGAEQFREMATTLGLHAYLEGEVGYDGKRSTAVVHLRSAVTGQRVASARFSGDDRTLPREVRRTFWSQLGPALARACAGAARPRRPERAPTRIEAGSPIDDGPIQAERGI